MIKSELIANVASKMPNIAEKKVTDALNLLLEIMSDALISGGRIEIRDFGSFSLHYHPPRNAHNPKTGVKLVAKGKYSPHFKPGKEMRLRVNNSRLHHPIQN